MAAENYKVNKCILFWIALFDYMGFTIAATTLPFLVFGSHSILAGVENPLMSYLYVGMLLAVYPFGQLLGAPILGSKSDLYGRKRVLIISLTLTSLAGFFTTFSIYIQNPYFLLISRFIMGFFASNISIAQASMLDMSRGNDNVSNISLVQLSLGLAWVLGAPASNFLSDPSFFIQASFYLPFLLLSVLLSIVTLLTMLFFNETKPANQNYNNFKLGVFKNFFSLFKKNELKKMFLIWSIFIGGWALYLQFLPSFLSLAMKIPLAEASIILAFMGCLFAISQIVIVRPLSKRINSKSFLKYLMWIPGLSAVFLGTFHNIWCLIIVAIMFPTAMGFILPSLVATTSDLSNKAQRGSIMGALQSLQAIMTILISLLGGFILSKNHSYPTLFGGYMILIAYFLFIGHFSFKDNSINKFFIKISDKLCFNKGSYTLAAWLYFMIIIVFPNKSVALARLANIIRYEGDINLALKLCEKSLSLNENNYYALYTKLRITKLNGNTSKNYNLLDNIHSELDYRSLQQKSFALHELGYTNEALSVCDYIQNNFNLDSSYFYTRSKVEYALGKLDKAIENLKRSLLTRKRHVEANNLLSLIEKNGIIDLNKPEEIICSKKLSIIKYKWLMYLLINKFFKIGR